MTNQPRPALVIGSGGVRCAASIGLWKALRAANIDVDMIVGCSGGALYATCIALGYPPEEMARMTMEFWTGDVMSGYAQNLRAAMSGEMNFNERSGIVDDVGMMTQYAKVFGEKTFSDAKIPLSIVATDLKNGEKVVLTSGRLLHAVRASSAIPMIYAPCEIDGRLLTDGAASDPLPVDVAIKAGARVILAMGFELPYRARLRSFNAVQNQYTSIFMNNLLKSAYAFHNLAHHAEIIAIWPDFGDHLSAMDAQQFPRIIEAGEKAMQEHLPYVQRLFSQEI